MSPPVSLPSGRGAVAVAAVGLVALAVGGAFAFGLVGDTETVLDQVPDDADVVAEIDPAVVDDERTRTLLATGLRSAGFGSADVERVTASIEARSGLVADGVDSVVVYGRYDEGGQVDPTYGGAIVHGNLSSGPVIVALSGATGARYAETTVGDATVYRPNESGGVRAPTVAVLGEGEFAIGTEGAVADAVAVANGQASGLQGTLRKTLADTEDGLVTAAARIHRDRIVSAFPRLGEYTRLGNVQVVAGAYDTTGDGVVLRGRLRTNGTAAARDIAGMTRSGFTLATNRIYNETTVSVLEAVDVEREGRDVTLSVETTVPELRRVAAYYGLVGER